MNYIDELWQAAHRFKSDIQKISADEKTEIKVEISIDNDAKESFGFHRIIHKNTYIVVLDKNKTLN